MVTKVQLLLYVKWEVRFCVCHDGGESSCIFMCIHKSFAFQNTYKRNVHIQIQFIVVLYRHEFFFDFHDNVDFANRTKTLTH